jgi:hypothetical protein
VYYKNMPTNFFDRPFVVPAIIFGVALLAGLCVVGWGIENRNVNNVISVTGSASQNVTADTATWAIDIRRTAYAGGTAAAYAFVAQDGAVVEQYLKAQNFASSSVTASVISTDENYSYSSNSGGPVTYDVHQTVTVETTDVNKVEALSHNLSDLNARVSGGTTLSPNPPEYYVSNLPELRVSLLGQAVADAKARAEQIAKSGGSSVGALSSASSGVVQVLAPNSTNVEDYGSYDTSTIHKQVMVTAHVTFYVK